MSTTTLEGRPGNLTHEQEEKLRELWIKMFEIFGILEKTPSLDGHRRASNAVSSPALGSDSPNLSVERDKDKDKRKSRSSWFSRSAKSSPNPQDDSSDTASISEDKYGLNKEFKKAIAGHSPEDIRSAFWSMVKCDDPDAVMCRYLRARKWDVQAALVMFVSTLHWRMSEMKLDDEIMFKGEGGFAHQATTGEGGSKQDAADFCKQFKIGKSFVHGVDREGRPVTVVRARTHHPGHETQRSLEMYTVYYIETARFLLKAPVDTATIVFDLSNFSLSNMDYAPVKFMVKCFEANYPESLGSVLIYKAPWLFQGIWKIIRGWLDPVVASKVHFCSHEEELSEFIERKRTPRELGGEEDWEYEYVEPVQGENDRMKDTASRDKYTQERKALSDEYEQETIAWAKHRKQEGSADRAKLRDQLRDNYWKLDPYVRARSILDRIGVIHEGGRVTYYPEHEKVQDKSMPPPKVPEPRQQQQPPQQQQGVAASGEREKKVESWATAPEKPIANDDDVD